MQITISYRNFYLCVIIFVCCVCFVCVCVRVCVCVSVSKKSDGIN